MGWNPFESAKAAAPKETTTEGAEAVTHAPSNVVDMSEARQNVVVSDPTGVVIGHADSVAEARKRYTQNAIDQREAA